MSGRCCAIPAVAQPEAHARARPADAAILVAKSAL